MAGKDTPDFTRVCQFGASDFEVFEGNALAIKHTVDVVVGLYKELGWIGKWLILREPSSLRMAMGTDDR